MKKLAVIIMLLLVTGCGKSQINCVKEQKRDYITIEQNMIINFKYKKLENAIYNIDAVLVDEYKESNAQLTDILKEEFLSFEKDYGIKLNVQKNDKGAKISLDISKENFNKIYLKNNEETKKDNIIKLFEKNGYTCS